MAVMLEIPEEALVGLDLPPHELTRELRRDLAVVLYARGALPIGKAMELADLPRHEFELALKVRQVRRPFDESDLAGEME